MIIIIALAIFSFSPSGCGEQLQISLSYGTQNSPVIFGDKIVWADDRNGNWDLYSYDILSGTEIPLVLSPGNQDQPSVYGNYVIWRDDRNGNYDIYMLDPISGKDVPVISNEANQTSPIIYGPWLVWEDDRNGNYDIFLYDLNAKKEIQITSKPTNEVSPTIFGETIVYLDDKDGDYEIFAGIIPSVFPDFDQLPGDSDPGLDIPVDPSVGLKDVIQITSDTVDPDTPRIWGYNIIWADARSGNKDIYLYEIISRSETKLTHNPSDQSYPVIYGNTILWQDSRDFNSDIYQYDLTTKTTKKVSSTKGNEHSIAIFDNRIAWVSDVNGNDDIFYVALEYTEPEQPDKPKNILPGRNDVENSGSSRNTIFYGLVIIIVVLVASRLYSRRKKPEKEVKLPTIKEIHKLRTKEELVKACKYLGLNYEGNKKRLKRRLITYINMKELEKQEFAEVSTDSDVEDAQVKPVRRSMRKKASPAKQLTRDVPSAPPASEYDADLLIWDDGLVSTGIIGEEEMDALGLL